MLIRVASGRPVVRTITIDAIGRRGDGGDREYDIPESAFSAIILCLTNENDAGILFNSPKNNNKTIDTFFMHYLTLTVGHC
jgi:hypothetical protein